MNRTVSNTSYTFLAFLPFLLFAGLNAKANLKRPMRSRQFLMPVVALLYCLTAVVLFERWEEPCIQLVNRLPELVMAMGSGLSGLMDGQLEPVGAALIRFGEQLGPMLEQADKTYILLVVYNTSAMLVYLPFKRILAAIMRRKWKSGKGLHELAAKLFYTYDPEADVWYLKSHMAHARTYARVLYYAAMTISMVMMLVTVALYDQGLLAKPLYPVFAIILTGEVFFLLDGLTAEEAVGMISGEDDRATDVRNYTLLRNILRRLFGDKLTAENTTVGVDTLSSATTDELLVNMEESGDSRVETYAKFMRKCLMEGKELDHNFLDSGMELVKGNSILFNDPFYYDLIPYAFFAMDRTLLRHKKVLIILGRHGTEQDVAAWCEDGLRSVSHVPGLWRIGVLSQQEQGLDVGIITRSAIHDMELHEANHAFFAETEFVVLIEPSRLITTAQVGLNSIIRYCHTPGKSITFCSTDKNCDGLLDALSHILMTSISEVSATSRHRGVSSYMCWAADQEYLQHRMLPNLSRYLGMGTELSFAVLKHQVSRTAWYGGDAFPVVDMHWIVKQYYYELLHYAGLPESQQTIDRCFYVSPNLWNVRQQDSCYLTVEDESFNLFEIKRSFSTRAISHGFINVISQDYLLRDYMTENDTIFDADPKAIPYIVADYARTPRNVAFRLCLRMCSAAVPEHEVRRELMLIGVSTDRPLDRLWHEICFCCQPIAQSRHDVGERELLTREVDGKTYTFDKNVIQIRHKYSVQKGCMVNQYFISDPFFKQILLSDLQSASYIAEEEDGRALYLGTELKDQIFQRYLPGQFFTFSGKYYEMLSVTAAGDVLIRRAADHIHGRPSYRQVRKYLISAARDSEVMGSCRTVGGLGIRRRFADFRVQTPAYWHMEVYNDFSSGKKVEVNGIPDRVYFNKQILQISFLNTEVTDKVRCTLAVLLNEVFRTLFAENQAYIVASTPGCFDGPFQYSVEGTDGFAPDDDAIYIIEDSQLDVGLLVAVERNLDRIFSIVCDYLEWHFEALEASVAAQQPQLPVLPEDREELPAGQEESTGQAQEQIEEHPQPEKKKGFFRRLWEKIRGIFSGRRKQEPVVEEQEPAVEEQEPVVEEQEPVAEEQEPVTEEQEPAVEEQEPAVEEQEPAAEEQEPVAEEQRPVVEEQAPMAEEQGPVAEEQEPVAEEQRPVVEEQAPMAEEQEPVVEEQEPVTEEQEPVVEEQETEKQDPAEKEQPDTDGVAMLMSIRKRVTAYMDVAASGAARTGEVSYDAGPGSAAKRSEPERRPYHERYYLLYGGSQVPEMLDLEGTKALLEAFGYGGGALHQVRKGKNTAELIGNAYEPNQPGVHYCDFCGVELTGTEYDILSDGRERCHECSKTAVKTAEEFERIYKGVKKNMETFYGISISAPINVQMVNAKRLHQKLGRTFVPTGNSDGRVLGVAIRDKNGYTILLENGSPRLASAMTIAHELTHIWQYLNWDAKAIQQKYGAQSLEIYEGMAKWSEIQYAYLIGEADFAKREELITLSRQDEYGRGFKRFLERYPFVQIPCLGGETPFVNPAEPL